MREPFSNIGFIIVHVCPGQQMKMVAIEKKNCYCHRSQEKGVDDATGSLMGSTGVDNEAESEGKMMARRLRCGFHRKKPRGRVNTLRHGQFE